MGFQQWSFYGLRAQHGCGREQRGLRCREAQDFHLLSQRGLEKPPRHWRVVNLTTHWSQDPVGSLPRTIPSRTSSGARFCFLPNACLLLLTVEILLHIHGKQLQTSNPGPGDKPLGMFWCGADPSTWASRTTLHGNTLRRF